MSLYTQPQSANTYIFGGGNPSSNNECSPTNEYFPFNTVKDLEQLEGTGDIGTISLRKNVDVRHISVENSTPFVVGIAITNSRYGIPPPILYWANPGEVRNLAVNSACGPSGQQFLWIFSPFTKLPSNDPHPLSYHANQFVIRSGNHCCEQGKQPNQDDGKPALWFWVLSYRRSFI